ncbi:MAG: hypothetical protein KUG81_08085 [Gammaproteobacteria bacterium]|nr:hypothetical protein [Gammaproteobacteria bacterium]
MSWLSCLTRGLTITACFLCITACDVMECGPLTKASSEYDLSGVYRPDVSTQDRLLAMGFNSSPKFIVDEHKGLVIENMPVVWRDWSCSSHGRKIEYDHATGYVGISVHAFPGPNDWSILGMTLDEINGDISKRTYYAGAELCENQGELIFRIPYLGGDVRRFLVFGRFRGLEPKQT